ncbi:MAG: 1-(5-phosphoribosyl)-5-[(5-phosphoribosylamino)methylideneamino]imidazole-4-carboxamide isomerase [Nitrospiria bacterium]
MILIPAIDIKGGRCVRLRQGEFNDETVYGDDPVEMARRWAGEGAEKLHLVDLDGAVQGSPAAYGVIERVIKSVSIPVQVGGGIRYLQDMDRYLSAGAAAVILGTVALKEPLTLKEACLSFQNKIIVGIDSRKGKVAVQGWTEQREETVTELALQMEKAGAAALILTDIEKDGMLEGPNVGLMEEVSRAVNIPVIASGGVTTLEQIQRLSKIPGVDGAIMGKALYEGRISLKAAIAAGKKGAA